MARSGRMDRGLRALGRLLAELLGGYAVDDRAYAGLDVAGFPVWGVKPDG